MLYLAALGTHVHHEELNPRFLPTKTNISVNVGGTAKLKCRIKDLGPKVVVWRKVNEDFPLTIGDSPFSQKTDEEISIVHNDDFQWDLHIKNVQERHSGRYECQISSTNGIKQFVELSVLSIKLTGTEYINLDQTIHLTCNVTGSKASPDDIDWFFNGQIIRSEDEKWEHRLYIVKYKPEIPGRSLISELRIVRALLKDNGNYVCRSSNMDTTGIKVNVLNADKELFRRDSMRDEYSKAKTFHEIPSFLILSLTLLHGLMRTIA
ncbi:hypothetical protein ScPMuIL_018811 [Solemya velum]